MSDDPMVLHPPHYGTARFGVECIAFTRLMMFNPGNAFKYVWRCEDKGTSVQDLEKALVYWHWAWDSGDGICPPHHRSELNELYFAHIEPKVDTDWMAAVLGDILFQEWERVLQGVGARRAFFLANGGRP
jgi:hypothetical protein